MNNLLTALQNFHQTLGLGRFNLPTPKNLKKNFPKALHGVFVPISVNKHVCCQKVTEPVSNGWCGICLPLRRLSFLWATIGLQQSLPADEVIYEERLAPFVSPQVSRQVLGATSTAE